MKRTILSLLLLAAITATATAQNFTPAARDNRETGGRLAPDNISLGRYNRPLSGFTGAAITISGDELRRINPNNFARALEIFDPSFRVHWDTISPFYPVEAPPTSIRENLLEGKPATPTFIVDGREVSSTWILDADMGDIASVTLLKDAAATASFGASGGAGAVIITTIAPREGRIAAALDYSLVADLPDRAPWTRNVASHRYVARVDGEISAFRYGLSAFS
ncbi:MAG: TonB-dependent receptor plug domain-containing protein, partial [Odoribacteraceae bacterium]|nr:TonB-dependent receptor plug domain-containing protein [Odoribacteraceae bacterium]